MRNSDYISDRCVMDCLAVIKLRMRERGVRMTEKDLIDFKTRHKVSAEYGH